MKSLRYLNVVLTVIAFLLALNLLTAWTGPAATTAPLFDSPAHAQNNDGLVNAGAQRNQMIDLLKKQVQVSEQLVTLLKSGEVKVKIDGAEKK